jgi:excisionase family DNA binding protein
MSQRQMESGADAALVIASTHWPSQFTVPLASTLLRSLTRLYLEELPTLSGPWLNPARLLMRYYDAAGRIIAAAMDRGSLHEVPSLWVWRQRALGMSTDRYDFFMRELMDDWLYRQWPASFPSPMAHDHPNHFQSACALVADLLLGTRSADPESDSLSVSGATVSEAANVVNRTRATISKWCSKGLIRHVGTGSDRRVDLASLRTYLQRPTRGQQ